MVFAVYFQDNSKKAIAHPHIPKQRSLIILNHIKKLGLGNNQII
ncbi:hypothetical protein VB713_28095 [Anabaena cylindrica UHCC 0172]|nr:hypothetical protein [Anabaena cylindrica]MEA5554790.1 hypothetical protein [Anabaena cylindrica UHCC 0172]